MRFLPLIFILLTLLGGSLATAEELHLRDGTLIKGNLLSFDKGIYTFSSKTLGQIKIPAAQVLSITQQSSHTTPDQQHQQLQALQEIQEIQAKIMGNEATMQLLLSLQDDPDILAIMQDPQIMEAIQNSDFKKLERNPKLQKLMEKSQIKAIKKRFEN